MIHESMINLMFVAIWVSRGAVLMLVMGGLGEGKGVRGHIKFLLLPLFACCTIRPR